MKRKSIEERFLANVRKTETCWLWTASTTSWGYGQIMHKGKGSRAHRVSWELHNGPIPTGLFVCHHCDVPACVNPAHLFLGTNAENLADMDAKGWRVNPRRSGPGEVHGHVTLTEKQVLDICQRPSQGLGTLAKEFNVTRTQISRIRRRKAWTHLAVPPSDSDPRHGEFHGNAKLTAAQVLAIRSRQGQTQRSLAKEFGVNQQHISDIRLGKRWAHLQTWTPPAFEICQNAC